MYDKLVKSLRLCTSDKRGYGCAKECAYGKKHPLNWWCMDYLFREAADAIEELTDTNVGKWIPVTERLPEEYTRVIGFMAWKAMTAIEYQNGKWYSIDHLEPLPDEAITHWMPLPEPPKEEEK